MRQLWSTAGLEAIETREITISRTFADFDDFWTLNLKSARLAPIFNGMSGDELQRLKERVRERLPSDAAGNVTCEGRANAVKGRVPA
jgi:hypothetical protein